LQALIGLFRTMRPKQWTKNVLFVLPGIIFDQKLFILSEFINVVVACILLILMSGSVYIINDLVDIEKDRQHPRKKFRPLPAGELPRGLAIAAAFFIPVMTLLFAIWFDWRLAIVLIIYLGLQLSYSFVLKNMVILDVLAVTAGFILRVAAGVVVIQVENFSPWLYACAGLLALFLVIGKRRQDLVALRDHAVKTRAIYREYNLPLLDDMLRMVTTATLITYIIYTIEAPTIKLAETNLALLTVPFVLYGLFRYLYLIHVKGEGSAPDEVLLQDRGLQIAMLLWGLTFVVLLYLIPNLSG